MSKLPCNSILALLLAAGLVPQAHAQEGKFDKHVAALNREIRNLVLGPMDPNTNILIMANPGIPVAKFEKDNDEDLDLVYQLADIIPKADPHYIPNGENRYSSLYKKILDNKQLIPDPPIGWTPDDEARLKEAELKVDPESPLMMLYNKYMEAYLKAVTERDAAAKGGKSVPYSLTQAVTSAKNAMEGTKNKVSSYQLTIQQLTSKDGKPWWASLGDKLTAAQRGDSYQTSFFPPAHTWHEADSKDWMKFSFKAGETLDRLSEKDSKINAELEGSYKSVSAKMDFKKDDRTLDALLSQKDTEITFELKRVQIMRRWLDEGVFQNRFYFLPDVVGGGKMSYGTFAKNNKLEPPMPVYVTSFFLVRNLVIKANLDEKIRHEWEHAIAANARVSVGSITVSGGYSRSDKGHDNRARLTKDGIEAEGVQILGFLGVIPPEFPNPDPKFMKSGR